MFHSEYVKYSFHLEYSTEYVLPLDKLSLLLEHSSSCTSRTFLGFYSDLLANFIYDA